MDFGSGQGLGLKVNSNTNQARLAENNENPLFADRRAISEAQYIARENGDELHLHFLRDMLSAESTVPRRGCALPG